MPVLIYHLLSLLFFSPDIADMGSDIYAVRESASQHAAAVAPLNYFAVQKGLTSPDREIRRRCRETMAIANRRLKPFVVALTYSRAVVLIYGPGEWYLSRDQELVVLGGGYAFHHAMGRVAKAGGLLRRDGETCTAPCDVKHYGITGVEVLGYQPEEMVGFANVMRCRLRGMPDPK